MSKASHLPTHFPVGTRFVIEGRPGHIISRYIAFPNGRRVDLDLNARPAPGRRAFSGREVSSRAAQAAHRVPS